MLLESSQKETEVIQYPFKDIFVYKHHNKVVPPSLSPFVSKNTKKTVKLSDSLLECLEKIINLSINVLIKFYLGFSIIS